jgi:hypothetical protein
MICAFVAAAFVIAFSAVNLFIPYALIVFSLAMALAYFFGVPCGLFTREARGGCRLGFC